MSKKQENGNVVKYIIFPVLVASFIGIFVLPEVRLALALYVAMSLWSLNAYRQSTYQEEVYGIKKGIFKKYLIGLGLGGIFLIISAVAPAFSLLTPTLSLSVSEDVRWVIIVLLAPLAEEAWRSATKGYLQDIYKWKFGKINVVQALIFAALHTLVYGIALDAYTQWFEVYGVLTAVLGSLIAAFTFGLLSGYLMERYQDIVPSIGAHQIINFWLVTKGLIVVSSFLSLII